MIASFLSRLFHQRGGYIRRIGYWENVGAPLQDTQVGRLRVVQMDLELCREAQAEHMLWNLLAIKVVIQVIR